MAQLKLKLKPRGCADPISSRNNGARSRYDFRRARECETELRVRERKKKERKRERMRDLITCGGT